MKPAPLLALAGMAVLGSAAWRNSRGPIRSPGPIAPPCRYSPSAAAAAQKRRRRKRAESA